MIAPSVRPDVDVAPTAPPYVPALAPTVYLARPPLATAAGGVGMELAAERTVPACAAAC